ncbi:ACP phosphodiesterase [Daejeonella oryzae]|uniref:ACP phosphodiesterase n=1 Tax=Daejeonella oryzae TaxID=1122943 RepID=UPI0004282A2F|nr:hypothetical protein [Daejeonella oryzae]
MNFLSHYYFDRNTSDPHQVLGSVLPDLVKNANKSWNLHPEKRKEEFTQSDHLTSILCGWRRHIFVDNYFHNSPFFTEHTKNIRTAIAPILEHSPVRPSFMAHIALEIMLDSLLLTREIVDPQHFYNHLSQSDRPSISHFLEINQLQDTTRFLKFFDHFIQVNYLNSYRESHNVMYALHRICMRIWENPLNETQKIQLTAVLIDYLKHLEISFMNIFDDIEQRLNQPVSPNTLIISN